MSKASDTREVQRLAEYVHQAQEPILADEYMGLIPLGGRRLYFQPFEYKQLQAANLWSEAPLIESIQRQEFSVILLYEPADRSAISTRWTAGLRNTIYAHYKLENTLARNYVYLPQR
jgi:hypothetical protein